MDKPIAVKIECAKGEIMNAMQHIQDKYALPPCIMDGVISSVLAEVRAESKLEIINATRVMMKEAAGEIKKAISTAKEPSEEEQGQL